MDRIDMDLLVALEGDGRQSFAALAEVAGLSKTSSWSRVQAMEEAGTIRGYRADVDPAAFGLMLTAYVSVMIDFAQRDAFETAVIADPAIIECSTTAGEGDYLLKLYCADVGTLDDLLRNNISLLPGVQRSTTTIAMKTIKSGASLTAAARTMRSVVQSTDGRRRRRSRD